jgi:hypothetical protein
MADDLDDGFYKRADAHIHLSNDQMAQASRGKVSASMLYGAARFNAYTSATGFDSAEEMANARGATIAYYLREYEEMLAENLDDYIANFDSYMKPGKD